MRGSKGRSSSACGAARFVVPSGRVAGCGSCADPTGRRGRASCWESAERRRLGSPRSRQAIRRTRPASWARRLAGDSPTLADEATRSAGEAGAHALQAPTAQCAASSDMDVPVRIDGLDDVAAKERRSRRRIDVHSVRVAYLNDASADRQRLGVRAGWCREEFPCRREDTPRWTRACAR